MQRKTPTKQKKATPTLQERAYERKAKHAKNEKKKKMTKKQWASAPYPLMHRRFQKLSTPFVALLSGALSSAKWRKLSPHARRFLRNFRGFFPASFSFGVVCRFRRARLWTLWRSRCAEKWGFDCVFFRGMCLRSLFFYKRWNILIFRCFFPCGCTFLYLSDL